MRFCYKIMLLTILYISFTTSFAGEVTRKYDYKGFNGVSVGYGMKVEITQSKEFSVQIKADEKDIDDIVIEMKENNLVFKIDVVPFRKRSEILISITMPELNRVNLSGGSQGRFVMDVSSSDFSANLSGGSILKGTLKSGNVALNLSGGSKTEMDGNGADISVNGSGGAIIKLKEFRVNDVSASLSGGCQMSIHMNGTLSASQSGGSQIVYYGDGKVGSTKHSGGSSVRRGS